MISEKEYIKYCKNDVKNTKKISKSLYSKKLFYIVYRNVCKMYPQYLKWQKIMITRYLVNKRLKEEK